MVNTYRMLKRDFDDSQPDLFNAAANDDPIEMEQAISLGQSLNDQEDDLHFTPVHVAAISGSQAFLRAAVRYDFDPWLRDRNLRLAIDHAAAKRFREGQKILLNKMYPFGWDKS